MELQFAGLDFGEIEHLVDQIKQVLSGLGNALQRLDEIVLAQVLGVFQQHLGNADDGVERRAQLVAHIGEKLALGLSRLHRLIPRLRKAVDQLLKLCLTPLQFGNIGKYPDDSAFLGSAPADL